MSAFEPHRPVAGPGSGLDQVRRTSKPEDMADHEADERAASPLLTLGRVDLLRVQVGYRADPEGPAYEQFLLDVPVPEVGGAAVLGEERILAALEPTLYAGSDTPRHYSLHQHRWHTSWGASPGALEIGLLVTTGSGTAAVSQPAGGLVTRAFRDLLEAVGRPEPTPTSREAAIVRARRGAATAYGLDPDTLSLSAEQHDPVENSWAVRLRTVSGDEYDVAVGLVDGYAGSVRVRREGPAEVFDAVGLE